MSDFDLDGLLTFWSRRGDDILELVLQHLAVVALSVLIATIVGVLIGILVWNRPVPRSLTIAAAGVALTIPSLALLALITPVFASITPLTLMILGAGAANAATSSARFRTVCTLPLGANAPPVVPVPLEAHPFPASSTSLDKSLPARAGALTSPVQAHASTSARTNNRMAHTLRMVISHS